MAALRTAVMVVSPEGQHVVLPPGEPVPAWAVKAVGDLDVWVERPDEGRESDEGRDPEPDEDAPAGNASREAWVSYALTQGADADDLEDLTRDEIRHQYEG